MSANLTTVTQRLELIPATVELTRAALESNDALAAALDAVVPESWPPDFLDPLSLEFTLARLAEGAEQEGWWLHFVVLAHDATGRTLIGSAGYKVLSRAPRVGGSDSINQ